MKQLKAANIFWVFILGILIFLSVLYSYISIDAPYYLSIAEDISTGLILYKDIYSSYTPVMMYLNSIISFLFHDPDYKYYLIFQYFIIAVSSGVLFKICKHLNLNNSLSIFLSLFLIISLLSSDGIYIILEVYVILFVLISYLLMLRGKFLLCGLFLACSFLTKQYGILNYAPFFLLLLADKKTEKNHYFHFILGSIIPILIFLLYFNIIKDVSVLSLFKQLTRNGLTENMLELNTSVITFLIGAKVFILLLIPLFFLKVNPIKNRIDGILIIGILVNMIPLFIQSFAHYFILTYPFIFILIARNITPLDNRSFIVLNLVLILISTMLFQRIFKFKDEYNNQLDVAKMFHEEYPIGSKVFLYKGFRYLYILNNYENPVLKEIGYRYEFHPNLEFKKIHDVISKE